MIYPGMEAVRPPIVQGATTPLAPEKKVGNGIGRGRGNIDTRIDIAHAPTHTDAKRKGADFIHHWNLQKSASRPVWRNIHLNGNYLKFTF